MTILVMRSGHTLLFEPPDIDSTRLNAVIDSLIRYAFETGFLTCAGTVISMLCWLTMPNNLVFLGLHFVIGKLYANSLLVTLNMREVLRRTRPSGSDGMEYNPQVHILDSRRRRPGPVDTLGFNFDLITKSPINTRAPSKAAQNMEVNVETSVEFHE
ncbi:hypothetical protein D9619_000020 [Psilocybe cf. subviscida]|uniref:DUF6534 domain-containing protein n=1 Tax=Psilocybe cf. subviscida TaxID=2480587 RepID=A0A8H5F289_9AGAR|nr:hypothetical protein D9619_000020 [Psilocybe cf. subviscida]